MKKTILGEVAALLCSAVFAEMDLAGGTLTFVNKLDIEPVLYTKGSYLPVSDSNVSYGALGTDGFTVLYMPVEGLKITAGLPSSGSKIYNFGFDTSDCIDKDGKYTYKTRPVVNSGVEYTYDERLCFAFIVNDLFFNKSHYRGGKYANSDYKPYYKTNLGFYASFDANKWLGQNLTVNTSKNGMSLLDLNCARKEQTSCLLLSGTFVRCCKSFYPPYHIHNIRTAATNFVYNFALNSVTPLKILPHSYTQHHFPAPVIHHDKERIFLQLFQIELR